VAFPGKYENGGGHDYRKSKEERNDLVLKSRIDDKMRALELGLTHAKISFMQWVIPMGNRCSVYMEQDILLHLTQKDQEKKEWGGSPSPCLIEIITTSFSSFPLPEASAGNRQNFPVKVF